MAKEAKLIVGEQFNIRIIRGDSLTDLNAKFLVVDQEGAPVDLSGYTDGTFEIKTSRSGSTEMSVSKTGGGLVLGNGFWNLDVTDPLTDISPSGYIWQMRVTDGTDRYTIGYGRCQVEDNVIV